jgi:hypothetical protein
MFVWKKNVLVKNIIFFKKTLIRWKFIAVNYNLTFCLYQHTVTVWIFLLFKYWTAMKDLNKWKKTYIVINFKMAVLPPHTQSNVRHFIESLHSRLVFIWKWRLNTHTHTKTLFYLTVKLWQFFEDIIKACGCALKFSKHTHTHAYTHKICETTMQMV